MKQESNFELEIGGESEVVIENGLGTFQDEEQQTKVISEAVPFPEVFNPYPDQTPKMICERWYQINPLTMTFTKTSLAGFTKILPFYELTSGSTSGTLPIQYALKTFRYIRWRAIEIRFQMSSVPQIYGWLAFMSLPDDMIVNNDPMPYLSFADCTFLDISVQDDVCVSIPWRHPDQWCDWYDQLQLASANQVDKLLNPQIYNYANPVNVLDSTASGICTIKTFARFVGFEAAGHIDGTDDIYEGQMDKFATFMRNPDILSSGNAYGNFVGRGVDPNLAFKDEIHNHYYGNETKSKPQSASAPDPEVDDPDLRNNPFGSLVVSHSRYVSGTGTQIAPCRDQTIREIISMPTCIGFGSILASDTLRLLYDFNVLGYSRIQFMSQLFRMWRGSRKLTIIVFSTPFISARLNFIVAWGKTTPTGIIGSEVVQDVTIRGTTKVELEVPFLNSTQWLPTFWQRDPADFTTNNPMPKLYVKVIQSPLTVGDVTPSLPFVLYEQASPDFEFRSLVNPNPILIPGLKYEGQMKIATFGGGSYGSPKPLPNSSDTEMSVGDICHRWSGREGGTNPAPYPEKSAYGLSPSMGAIDMLSMIYGFWSGQFRMKMFLPETNMMVCWHTRNYIDEGNVTGMEMCNRPEDGMVNVAPDLTRVLDVTHPFLYTHQFMPLRTYDLSGGLPYEYANKYNIGSFPRVYWDGDLHDELSEPAAALNVYVAGGSDFTFYFPVPPPAVIWWPSYNFFPRPIPDLGKKVVDNLTKIKTTNVTSSCTPAKG